MEDAVKELSDTYGAIFRKQALNILKNREDAEECVSDLYLSIRNSILPNRPDSLLAYASRILRNLALDRYRYENALKRPQKEQWTEEDPLDQLTSPGKVEDALMEEIQQAIQQNLWIRQAWKKPDLSRPIRVRPTKGSDEIEFYYIFLQTDTEQFGLFLSVEEKPMQVYSFSRGVEFVVDGKLINARGGLWGERSDLSQEIIDAVGEELKKEGQ